MTSFHLRAVAMTLVVVACAGCESATGRASPSLPNSSASSLPTPRTGPQLSGTVAIAGGATIPTTTFVTGTQMDVGQAQKAPPAGVTCADYAAGFMQLPGVVPGSFVPPVLQTTGFHNMLIDVVMESGYRGPGMYDSAQFPSLQGNAVEGIGAGASQVFTVFTSSDSGEMILTVKADGSGSLHIKHWDSDEVRQSAGSSQVNISGDVTWVCRD